MIVLVDLQTVGVLVTATSVTIAAVYYIFTLRMNMRTQELALKAQQQTLDTRQAQLFMQLADTYIDKGYRTTALEMLSNKWSWTNFDDFLSKYGPDNNPEAWNKFQLQLSHWSQQGILVRDGLISAATLNSWWGWVPVAIWEKYEPIILEYRGRYESPPKGMFHMDFEDLYYSLLVEMEKYRKDFVERVAPMRTEKRKALGLKQIPPYT
jgi:hypothetical protein